MPLAKTNNQKTTPSSPDTLVRWLPYLLLGLTGLVVWVNWIAKLSLFWDSKSYYNYGWAVPFLALFLLWRRFATTTPQVRFTLPGFILLVIGLMMLPGIQLLNEAIPNWRLIAWAHTFAVILVSLGIVIAVGGLRYGTRLSFPILFLLTALPWPMRYEIPIISGLTEGVVLFTVDSLRFFAVPAVYTGNVIEVGERTVMVGDVCSGIRSLQALVMVGLFFGELFRHGLVKRLLLVFSAGFFAFAFNCLRALALTLIVLYGEPETFDKWHDWIGAIAFGGSCIGLFLVSERLNSAQRNASVEKPPFPPILRPISAAFGVVALAWVVFWLSGIEWWFGRNDFDRPSSETIAVQWPDPSTENGFQFLNVPSNVMAALHYDSGQRAEFYLPDGSRVEIYYLTWDNGHLGMEATDNHSPDICMVRNGGAIVEAKTNPVPFSFSDIVLPFDTYQMRYPQIDQSFHTFRAVWLRGTKAELNEIVSFRTQDQSISDHFRGAFERIASGRRNFPVAMLLIGIEGRSDIEDAWQSLEPLLREITIENPVQPEAPVTTDPSIS